MGNWFTTVINNAIDIFDSFSKPKDKMICATHNEYSIDKALSLNNTNISYAHLMGMSDSCSLKLAKNGYHMLKYVPYGAFKDTFPYLTRRLFENLDFTKYYFR